MMRAPPQEPGTGIGEPVPIRCREWFDLQIEMMWSNGQPRRGHPIDVENRVKTEGIEQPSSDGCSYVRRSAKEPKELTLELDSDIGQHPPGR